MIEGNAEVTKHNWKKGIYEQINNEANDNTFTKRVKKEIRLKKPLDTDVVTTHTAEQAYKLVVAYAGCSKMRDEIDTRIAEETKLGTATYTGSVTPDAKNKPGLIDTPDDVMPKGATSPWPALSDSGVNPADLKDSDGDGIPDIWEAANGLNPHDASDGALIQDKEKGYTNLEVYLNSLVEDITREQI